MAYIRYKYLYPINEYTLIKFEIIRAISTCQGFFSKRTDGQTVKIKASLIKSKV